MAQLNTDARYARLLDAWAPPEDAGDPVGCLATSFTFDAAFFEDECLARFVRMETDPDESGAIYLLEREEKLAELAYAGCIVDAHHCRGSRSLRWDLLRARVPRNGVMHAKLAILHWTRRIRVLIASANLTQNGYRQNIEVFGTIDFHDEAESDIDALAATLEFAGNDLLTLTRADGAARDRVVAFLSGVRDCAQQWTLLPPRKAGVSVIFTAPGKQDIPAQVGAMGIASQPFHFAAVASPFFDRSEGPYRPAESLWNKLMRRRGAAEVHYHVPADAAYGETPMFVRAPRSLLTSAPTHRTGCSACIAAILPDQQEPRELHAKSLWLESDHWTVLVLGSSNFTSAGYGIGRVTNVEANLLYWLRRDGQRRLERDLWNAFPLGEAIEDPSAIEWQPSDPAGVDEPDTGLEPLPEGFGDAVFEHEAGASRVRFTFSDLPEGWSVHDELDERIYLDAESCEMDGLSNEVVIGWTRSRPPTGFVVRWKHATGDAWWPVTVASSASLPPPEELKDLPLDVLLDILTSARPLHRNEALRRHLEVRERESAGDRTDRAIEVDPHKQVDTSTFLLQRTRRLSWGLAALRERLERPFATLECLEWRLRGPVGVLRVAEAIRKEARSDEERAFLIAELMLELRRAIPTSSTGAVPAEAVGEALRSVAKDLETLLPTTLLDPTNPSAFTSYLNDVTETGKP